MDRELTPEEITELLPGVRARRGRRRRARGRSTSTWRAPDGARDEVAELQVAASMLAHAGGPPPEGVWERLESAIIGESPPHAAGRAAARRPRRSPAGRAGRRAPEPPLAVAGGGGRGRRARVRWPVAGRAVRRRARRSTDTAALARTAATAPGARHAVLTDADGNTLATAVVTRDGTGYLTSELPPAAAGPDVPAVGHHPHRHHLARRARTRSDDDRVQGGRADAEPRDHHRGGGWRAGEPQRARRGRRRRLTHRLSRHAGDPLIRAPVPVQRIATFCG